MANNIMHPFERETSVSYSDANEPLRFCTWDRHLIKRLRRDSRFTELRANFHNGYEYAEFTIPKSEYDVIGGAKRRRRPLSPERNAAFQQARNDNRAQTALPVAK